MTQYENESFDLTQNSLTEITPKGANIVFLSSTLLQFIIGMFFYTIALTISMIYKASNEDKLFFYYISPIVEFSAVFMPAVLYLMIKKADFKKVLRLNKIKFIHIIPFIIIGISAQYAGGFLNNFIIVFLQQIGNVPVQEIPSAETISELIISILAIAVTPAIFEEILARGLIFKAYEGYGVRISIIFSALVFGIMHYDLQNFVFPVFFGLILAYVVYRTNSIFSGMIIHFTNNALAALILYFYPQEQTAYYEKITYADFLYYGIPALISSIVLTLSIYYIYKTTTPPEINAKISEGVESSPVKTFWPIGVCIVFLLISFTFSIYEVLIS